MPERLSKIFIFILLLCLFDCSRKDTKEGNAIGSIVRIERDVFYKKYNSLTWTKAKIQSPLYKGDYIRTGEDSSAIILIEQEKVILNSNTLIKIDKMEEKINRDVSVELVLLNGDIQIDSSSNIPKALSVKRLDNGKLIPEELSKLIYKKEPLEVPIKGGAEAEDKIELIYPCNDEVINIKNPIFRWNQKISGVIKIYSDDGREEEILVNNEESKNIELQYGAYKWEIIKNNREISNRCSFGVSEKNESMKIVKTISRRSKQPVLALKEKSEELVTPPIKPERQNEDIVKKRLNHIQTVIDRSIEHIKDTKKGIDPEKIKNYLEIYQKLDELTSLLQDLKVVQESLLIEILKVENPTNIVNYLTELEEIENNLKGIDREIKKIEEVLYKGDEKALK